MSAKNRGKRAKERPAQSAAKTSCGPDRPGGDSVREISLRLDALEKKKAEDAVDKARDFKYKRVAIYISIAAFAVAVGNAVWTGWMKLREQAARLTVDSYSESPEWLEGEPYVREVARISNKGPAVTIERAVFRGRFTDDYLKCEEARLRQVWPMDGIMAKANREMIEAQMALKRSNANEVPAQGSFPKTLAALTDGIEVWCSIAVFEPESLEIITTGGERMEFNLLPPDVESRRKVQQKREEDRIVYAAAMMVRYGPDLGKALQESASRETTPIPINRRR